MSSAIEMVEGDLLAQDVEVIVNAWNRNLIPHWLLLPQGVSLAIKRAGGIEPFRELRSCGLMPLGSARLTSAGSLPFRGIIHVAGIDLLWRSSERSVRESAKNALEIARQNDFRSIAFPAVGAGSTFMYGAREKAIWGVTRMRSLTIIEEEARQSSYTGRVVLVNFKRVSGS